MATWTLYTNDGDVAVDDVEAEAEEMLVVLKAANTTQPGTAPHYAVSKTSGEQLQTDETMDEKVVEEAIRRADVDPDPD